MKIRQIILTTLLTVFSTLALAEFDYYGSAPPELLSNVEKYHLNQGIRKMHAGQLDYAKGDFEFMLNYFPNHPRALMLLGDIAIKKKRPYIAEEAFKNAIDLYPDTASTYLTYGIFLQKIHKLPEAIEQYKTALSLDPDSADANYNIGLAYFEAQKYDLANEYAQKAYALNHPLPGLKNKLTQIGRWQTKASENTKEKGSSS